MQSSDPAHIATDQRREQTLNPSRPDPGQREKIDLKAFKDFMKLFEAPQRSVKIKI